jgi:hypothetical protein
MDDLPNGFPIIAHESVGLDCCNCIGPVTAEPMLRWLLWRVSVYRKG